MIELREDYKVFPWIKGEDLWIRGYLWNADGIYVSGVQLHSYFLNELRTNDPDKVLTGVNGCFALIWKNEQTTIAACDKLRTFPLLYSSVQTGIYVGDNSTKLLELQSQESFDTNAIEEFKSCFYVVGEQTLINNIQQIQAGECISINERKISKHSYYEHLHHRKESQEVGLEAEFVEISKAMESRLINSLDNKTVVIPLSGGYDSRFVLAILLQNRYTNVICYTYGRADGYEAETARNICKAAGLKWEFIEFNEEVFNDYFSEEADQYFKYAHYLSSLPYEQEFLAIHYLLNAKLIPKDSIVIPGFCADLLAGSYYPVKAEMNNVELTHHHLAEYIVKRHFKDYEGKNKQELFSKVLNEIASFKLNSIDDWISIHENWFTKNKVARYVINGLRAFEYFGIEWRMPLWDKDFMEFWYEVPNRLRIDRKFYKDLLEKYYFKANTISVHVKKFDDLYTHQSKWYSVRKFIPKSIRNFMKGIMIPDKDLDVNRFGLLQKMILQKLKDKKGIQSNMDLNYTESRYFLENFDRFK